jgi:hypothetical protein
VPFDSIMERLAQGAVLLGLCVVGGLLALLVLASGVAVAALGVLLFVLGFPFSLVGVLLLSWRWMVQVGASIRRVIRRLVRAPTRAPELPEAEDPPEWSMQDAVLDLELVRQIGLQLDELNAYRSEVLQLAGFAGALAAATVALTGSSFPWSSIANLAVALGAVVASVIALEGFQPLDEDVGSLVDLVDRAAALQRPAPSAMRLRALAHARKARAYKLNLRVIDGRHRLVNLLRVAVVLALLLLGYTAAWEANLASNNNKKSPTTTTQPSVTAHPANG